MIRVPWLQTSGTLNFRWLLKDWFNANFWVVYPMLKLFHVFLDDILVLQKYFFFSGLSAGVDFIRL